MIVIVLNSYLELSFEGLDDIEKLVKIYIQKFYFYL